MEDEKSASGKRGNDSDSSDGTRTLAEFNADVDRRIAVLRSLKQPAKARIAAATWLGESGDTRAIKALVQVYRSNKTSRGLKNACRSALSRFKALDEAIDRMEGEEIESALNRDENAWIVELLTDIAYNANPPRRRGCAVLLMNGVLVVLLALLFVIYQAVPTDVVSISQVMGNLGLNTDGSESVVLSTQTPVPTVDPFSTPLPTATPTEIPTATPLPTATPVTPDDVRLRRRDLIDFINRLETLRGTLDQLNINWTTLQGDPSLVARMCAVTPVEVPDDIVLAAGFAEVQPALSEAAKKINDGLNTLRAGWLHWNDGCAAGDVVTRINAGLQNILVARSSFDEARLFLGLIE